MADIKIPLKDLAAQYRALRAEMEAAITAFLEAGQYVLGPPVEKFERECAAYLGVSHAVGVGSGTDALLLALHALGVGAGDEVVTTPFTFVASADVVVRLGARPVFADVAPDTLNVDAARVAEVLTPRAKALLPVHLYGLPADVAALREAAPGVPVLEDAAQAMGAAVEGRKVGSLGEAAAFSFFPTKNLGACGDGGLVATDDAALAERVRRLRVHGASRKNYPEEIGYKSRLDGLQATILALKLRRLEAWTARLQELVGAYRERLAEVAGVTLLAEPPACRPAYHQFTIRASRRDELKDFLAARGVASAIYYPLPVHLTPAFAELGYGPGSFPEAERAAAEVLSLPLWPEMTEGQLEEVCAAVAAFYG
ncbi:MAG: DegT/DnrJ/EryC1/StrS family aminotransferase [Candidatus Coatesbacteria bacterium]|nr:MAG: DegT/DnrJ/EryC1/StrS family aminotransferase [Candidatus Coatesbacteria bacterium]